MTQQAASLPGAIVDRRTGAPSALRMRFDSHSVVVDSTVQEVTAGFLSMVSPMIALAWKGKAAGAFSVVQADAGIVVRGNDGPDECFRDPKLAAHGLYHRAVKALIDARLDLLWLHAGAMSLNHRAILLCGPSGNGKSTLVDELLRWDWSYLSDEVAPIDPICAEVLPFPLSPAKRVGGHRSLAACDVQTLEKVLVDVQPRMVSVAPRRISHIYFLKYAPEGGPVAIARCPSASAVIELLRNSFNPEERRDLELQRLCGLVERVQCAYLTYTNAQEAARQIVTAVIHANRLLDRAP
jgi:hypothetical protein